jgi:L-ribulose-5-phosphate 3-epimerase
MASRRQLLTGGAALLAAAALRSGSAGAAAVARRGVKFKLGVTDWTLKLAGQPEAVLMAGELGFDCLQVSVGRIPRDGKLVLSDKTLQKTYLAESKRHKCPIGSLYLDILHVNGLKLREDPLGPRWVAEAIDIAKALKVKVLLLPFFGKQRLENQEEIDYVADALKEIAPAASRAGVILALETTLAAQDDLALIERTKSKAVQVYYDVGNASKAGVDIPAELKLLGRERLAELHFKDNPHYLGEGPVDFPTIVDTLADLGYERRVLLETDSPSGDVEVDLTRNQAYVRRLIAARNEAAGIKKRGG